MRRKDAKNLNMVSSKRFSIGKEFEQSPIKDKRLLARLKQTAERLEAKPEKSIPEACQDWSETKSVYRLLSNERVDHDAIMEGHRAQTIRRMEHHRLVLCLQDTTSLNYTDHPQTAGIGPTTTAKSSLGLLVHTSLVVTPSGVPLGLLDQQIWARDPENRGKRHQRYELPIEEKESFKWLSALEQSTRDISSKIRVVSVGDREADIYSFFQQAHQMKRDVLVRARHDRRIHHEEKRLFTFLLGLPVAGENIVDVPRNSNINAPSRKARLQIRFAPVTIRPSSKCKGAGLPDIPLVAVLAQEVSAPEGVEPLEWLLLTTVKVNTVQEAIEKIEWYRHRWKIERFHFILKSGCQVESLQLETAHSLKNAIAIYSVVAWKLSWLTYQARETPDEPCDMILSEEEWKILYCTVHQTRKLPSKPPTLEETTILIARLGGFLARKGDGKPGVKVLWRGFQRFMDIVNAYQILKSAPL